MEEDRERTSMDHDLDKPDDPLLREQEGAAAEEAGSIGGRDPDYEGDEAARPLEEAGEGEAEGFELAERDLGEAASHGEGRYSPEADEFPAEEEADRADAVYGEPDQVDPTEVVRDPREGEDDPGAGPGLAPDR
jgi:hypothetical protein